MLPTDIDRPASSITASARMDNVSPVAKKRFRPILLSGILLALEACSIPVAPANDKSTGFINELPEGVALIAAPYQNLQEVILKPEDGCYWYRHVGPVETTMLPLRTVEGRPICTESAGKPLASG